MRARRAGLWVVVAMTGCEAPPGPFDAARDDVAAVDVARDGADGARPDVSDARADAVPGIDAAADATPDATPDAPRDAPVDGPADAALDARPDVPADAALDTPRPDAPPDAPADASTADAPPTADVAGARAIECAPPVPPGPGSGIACNAMFWTGFRFEVTAPGVRALEIGLQAALGGGAPGSVHATLVRLTSATDQPDRPDLTGGDVVLHALIEFPAGGAATIQRAVIDAPLAPGWYAAVYGTGAFGATAASATIPSAGGTGCVLAGAGFPFSIRQSDGMFILQGAVPHMFVTVAP